MASFSRLVVLFLALIVPTGNSLKCLSCDSYTYLDADFTDIDSEEDRDCVAGTKKPENQLECLEGSTCAIFEGTVTWFVKGYGFVNAQMTFRTCVRLLGPASFPPGGCFDSHSSYSFLHQLIGGKYIGRELTNFNGTFCGCNHTDTCNDHPGSAPVITRGHTPNTNPRGLQCVSCYHQVFNDPGYNHLDVKNPSCSEAAIEEDSIYYHTCANGGVCGVINGELNFRGINITYFERDCLYGITKYTTIEREDGLLCVSSQNVSQIVTSHLLSEAEISVGDFSGELCYCSTDFCELPGKIYKDAQNKENHSDVNVIHTGMLALSFSLWGILVFTR
ncbi:hypothetical protein HOLleu_00375 [Holothuria leucospilota]|uniref:Uncharacterized protein n=1 Tax=Holothuria leucospilota TaxID=206669 RepID=A0A9Q1CMV4_HOLLE|nr:hypothetical protein HOLleu_00375 [Holothuria leucospilota]